MNKKAIWRSGIPIILGFVVFLTFSKSLSNHFINWDDERNLTANLLYRGLDFSHLRWMFTTFLGGPYVPLTWLSFALDYSFWGMNPLGYHLTNCLLHSLNVVLFYFLTRRLLQISSEDPNQEPTISISFWSALAALFFGLHPLRVESVTWVTERKDVLSGFFYLLTVSLYVWSVKPNVPFWKNGRRYASCLVLYALALLSKASPMTLPVALLILDFYPLKRLGPAFVWLEKIPFFLLAAGAAALAAHGVMVTQQAVSLHDVGLEQRVCIAAYGAVFYLFKMIFPARLVPLYHAPTAIFFTEPRFFISLVIVGIGSLWLWLFRRRWPAVFAVWFYFLVMHAPASGIFQSASQIAADRFTYLSLLGWPILAAGFCARVSTPQKVKVILGSFWVTALGVLGYLTWQQEAHWADAKTLWAYVLKVDPQNGFAAYNLGDVYQKENNLVLANQYLQQALALEPDPAVYFKLGVVAEGLGHPDEALRDYRETLRLKPSHAYAANNLANLLLKEQFETVLKSHPNDYEAHSRLGILYLAAGDYVRAVPHLREALRQRPNAAADNNNLGVALIGSGSKEDGLKYLNRAVQLDPSAENFRRNRDAVLKENK